MQEPTDQEEMFYRMIEYRLKKYPHKYTGLDNEVVKLDIDIDQSKVMTCWYQHGKLHCENGPAIEENNNYAWFYDGKLHMIKNDKGQRYYHNGQKVSEYDYLSLMPDEQKLFALFNL